ncbi:MAG: hypothetical protein JWM59_4619 [Verrucomicrobiales bacterium]|nr:hypothetical protein [Verrucomicrobiales bacterium]
MKLCLLAGLAAVLSFSAVSLIHAADKPEPKPAVPPAAAPKVKPYPLKTCIVSDEELGSMGKPVSFTHDGQEIKICCKGCKPKFEKDPATYLKKLPKK